MCSSQYSRKCSFKQSHDGISRHAKNLWLSGDRCAPTELSTKELKARRKAHWRHLGELLPSSPDYDRQVLFIHLYTSILQQRQLKIEVTIRRA